MWNVKCLRTEKLRPLNRRKDNCGNFKQNPSFHTGITFGKWDHLGQTGSIMRHFSLFSSPEKASSSPFVLLMPGMSGESMRWKCLIQMHLMWPRGAVFWIHCTGKCDKIWSNQPITYFKWIKLQINFSFDIFWKYQKNFTHWPFGKNSQIIP